MKFDRTVDAGREPSRRSNPANPEFQCGRHRPRVLAQNGCKDPIFGSLGRKLGRTAVEIVTRLFKLEDACAGPTMGSANLDELPLPLRAARSNVP